IYEGVKGSLEQEFYDAHKQYMLRRRKEDVMADLPPVTHVDVWVDMSSKQAKQYELMDEEAMANVYESEQVVGRVSMANVLATNTWLKQFANSYCELEERSREWNDFKEAWEIKYKAIPTTDSPKLEALHEKFCEIGINDRLSGKQGIVFTQFSGMADMVTAWLQDKG
ncbi:MAG: hypothetical protein GTO63_25480, partial [Anaerolineae bacterium]|nr:hypothetical protein [Anaerolineae bacterium]NIN98081.1 hypothetical protein [Anaerolineae bacterium]